jgi:hypothetical protein
MTNRFRTSALAIFALALFSLAPAFGAVGLTPIDVSRVFTAAGNAGCTVSGASVTTGTTPSIITCAAAHNLVSGDQVQITGIVGTTTDNVTAYVSVLSSTTFSIYSDVNLTAGIIGTGAYSSGGAVSQAFDISSWTADWTIRVRVESLTAAKNVLISVQDSADGFVSDIKTLAVYNVTGSTGASGPYVEFSVRSYQLPSARFGVTNGRLRLAVQSISGSASASLSMFLQ